MEETETGLVAFLRDMETCPSEGTFSLQVELRTLTGASDSLGTSPEAARASDGLPASRHPTGPWGGEGVPAGWAVSEGFVTSDASLPTPLATAFAALGWP